MNKKSFFFGVLTGVVLTFVVLFIIGYCTRNTQESADSNDPIRYLEKPVVYEKKSETTFKVFQVIADDAALATEESRELDDLVLYTGNTVLILGEDFYSDQIITIKNPMRVGSYSYTNKGGMPMTVPVIEGNIE